MGTQLPLPHEKGTAAPLFLAHVCCGHSRPSQLLLSFARIVFVVLTVGIGTGVSVTHTHRKQMVVAAAQLTVGHG